MPQPFKIDQFRVQYQDKAELLNLKNEIFVHDCYYFATNVSQPKIIDAGAHIGLATLYFKKLYPGAEVTAIEPNPATFKLLEENVWANGLEDVICINAALAEKVGKSVMHEDIEGTWLSTTSFHQNAWNGQQKTKSIAVKTIKLSDLLTQPIDLVKLDIEGAELQVLKEAQAHLSQVNKLLIEFHPLGKNHFSTLQELLIDNNFELSFSKNGQVISQKDAQHGLAIIEANRLR